MQAPRVNIDHVRFENSRSTPQQNEGRDQLNLQLKIVFVMAALDQYLSI